VTRPKFRDLDRNQPAEVLPSPTRPKELMMIAWLTPEAAPYKLQLNAERVVEILF
jgi:hypothetical protein